MGVNRETSRVLLLVLLMCLLCILIFGGGVIGRWIGTWAAPFPPLSESSSLETAALKARLAVLENAFHDIGSVSRGVDAMVYSRYPFNIKNKLLINRGSDYGVSMGDVVLFNTFFVGQVREVGHSQSSVQTLFDAEMQLPVRIGKTGVDALLTGGITPHLTLIPKTAALAEGEIVYTASPNMPYGIPLGYLHNLQVPPGEVFQHGDLLPGYNPNEIHAVSLITTP